MQRDRTARPGFRVAMMFAGGMLAGIATQTSAQARGPEAAPLHKGGWIISGSAGLSSSHSDPDDARTTSLRFDPAGLVFVTPQLAIGARLNLAYAHTPSSNVYSVGVGPAARYFFSRSSERWLPFIGLSIEPSLTHGRTRGDNAFTSNQHSLLTDESIGVTRLVATHVGVTGELYANQLSHTNDPGGQSVTLRSGETGLRFGLTIFVH